MIAEGTWRRVPDSRGRRNNKQHFIPGSLDSAKCYLTNSMDIGGQDQINSNTCHGCHGPIGGGAHVGSATGKARCSLPHHLLCKGNIIEEASWRACPPNYVFDPNLVVSDTGFESTLNPSSFVPGADQRSTPRDSPNRMDETGSLTINTVANKSNVNIESGSNSGCKGVRFAEGTKQSQNSNDVVSDISDLPAELQAQIQEFRAKNQQSSKPPDKPEGELNITKLRSDPDLRTQVELLLQSLKENIPSLSPAPSANIAQSTSTNANKEWVFDSRGNKHLVNINVERSEHSPRPRPQTYPPGHNGVGHQSLSSQQEQFSNQMYRYEYRCSPTSGRVWQEKIPVAETPRREPSFRVEYRCSPTSGRVYQVRVPVSNPELSTPPTIPAIRWEWRVDTQTGLKYQVQVPLTPELNHGSNPHQYRDTNISRQGYQRADHHLGRVANQFPEDANITHGNNSSEIAGISKLEKSGTKKAQRVVEYSKQCPTKWAKSTNINNINLPLYTWGAISEIEASLSGRTNCMSEVEMLGKIRHIKCMLEVCCLNSNATDFNTFGWTIAKDYANKVEDEIQQGILTWSEITPSVRTGPLLLAQMDCQRQTQVKSTNRKEGENTKVCTTYNKCTTKGKCEYEVTNPEKSCQRKHECSWCKSNLGQSNKHQAWECKKKEA